MTNGRISKVGGVGLAAMVAVGSVIHLSSSKTESVRRTGAAGERREGGGLGASPGHRMRRPAPPEIGMTLQEAHARLVEARGMPDLRARSAASREVIAALCAAGHAAEAWNSIETEPGQVRSQQLDVFFHHAKLSDGMLYEKLLGLRPEEMSAGLRGLCQRYRPEELAVYLDSPAFRDFFAALESAGFTKNGLAGTLSPLLQLHVHDAASGDVAGQRSRMATAADYYAKDLLTPEVMVEVLKNANLLDTAGKLRAMKDIPDLGDGRNALQTYRRTLMAQLVKVDPPAALEAARGGPQPLMDLGNTFSSWVRTDAAAASAWYEANATSLPVEQRDAVATGGFAIAVDLGDHDTAREWVAQISKPGAREASLKFLATKERGK